MITMIDDRQTMIDDVYEDYDDEQIMMYTSSASLSSSLSHHHYHYHHHPHLILVLINIISAVRTPPSIMIQDKLTYIRYILINRPV